MLMLGLTRDIVAAQNSIFREFPHPCGVSGNDDCLKYGKGYECCRFEDDTGLKIDKCMTESQRGGLKGYQGTYIDNHNFAWTWTCPELQKQKQKADQALNFSDGSDPNTLPPFTEKRQEVIEILIWVTFISSSFWILGLPIYSFGGISIEIYYTWLVIDGLLLI